jgi:hypothetical protein
MNENILKTKLTEAKKAYATVYPIQKEVVPNTIDDTAKKRVSEVINNHFGK